jgi:hypothetical protein
MIFRYEKRTFIATLFRPSKAPPADGLLKPVFPAPQQRLAYLIQPDYFSDMEAVLFKLLEHLLPDYYVYPNLDLDFAIDYQKMKEIIGPVHAGYLLLSTHIDYCVAHRGSHLPYFGIELDGPYHFKPGSRRQRARDRRKNIVFDSVGLPLLRLKPTVTLTKGDWALEDSFLQDLRALFIDIGVLPEA